MALSGDGCGQVQPICCLPVLITGCLVGRNPGRVSSNCAGGSSADSEGAIQDGTKPVNGPTGGQAGQGLLAGVLAHLLIYSLVTIP